MSDIYKSTSIRIWCNMSSAPLSASPAVARALVKIRDEIDEILETLEISSDEKIMREIMEGLRQARRGEGIPLKELLKKLEKRR